MLKKVVYLIILMVFFIVVDNVSAATYGDTFDEHGMWISNEFVNKTKNGSTKYQQMTLIVRKSDNRFVYCIEPGASLQENNYLVGYDTKQEKYANLTSQQWDRIKLLAYYGYGYNGHTDIKWYVITQFMIWQTNNLGYDIYFTDKLNGNRIEKYTAEMIELDNLVNSHYKIPNFNVRKIELFWNEEKTFTDINNVLENYTINSGPNIEFLKNGNNLTITSKNYGNSYIIFNKKEKRFSNKPIVYIDSNNQDLLLPGYLDDMSHHISVNMNYGTINVNKLDYDTKSNIITHQASLENAKYGLFKEDGQLLEEQYSSKEGYLKFNSKLEPNKYFIQEMIPSKGYQLDETKYYFDINKDNYNITLNVYEKVIKENFEIIKVLENENSGQLEFEKGIEFGVFDINDNLINNFVTSDFGTIKFSLPYGKYILKQLSSYDGYEKIKDYEIEVLENNKDNKIVFKDNFIKYKVQLNVKEQSTLKNLENIEFELYDKENKKICYVIDYPTEKRICKYSTDKEGNILFPQYFNFDDYTIKLIYNEEFEYSFDNETIEFTINNDTKYIQFDNYRLVQLEYFLKKIEKEEIKENIKEENPIVFDSNDSNNHNDNEIIDITNNNELQEELLEDGIVVKVPNTFKNVDYGWALIIIIVIITKKILYYSKLRKI